MADNGKIDRLNQRFLAREQAGLRLLPSLRLTIMTVFILVLTVVAATITTVNYTRNSRASIDVAQELLHEVSGRVVQQFRTVFDPALTIVDSATSIPYLSDKPSLAGHPMLANFLSTLARNPQVTSIYIG